MSSVFSAKGYCNFCLGNTTPCLLLAWLIQGKTLFYWRTLDEIIVFVEVTSHFIALSFSFVEVLFFWEKIELHWATQGYKFPYRSRGRAVGLTTVAVSTVTAWTTSTIRVSTFDEAQRFVNDAYEYANCEIRNLD